MKLHLYLILLLIPIWQSCKKPNKTSTPQDFELQSSGYSFLSDSTVKEFIYDYIVLPENIHRKVFTIFFDQRFDTLALNIWRYPYRHVSLKDVIGYFNFNGRTILLYSPFSDFLNIPIDEKAEEEINKSYKEELEYYENHKHEMVMWQLLYSFYSHEFIINKNYNRITYTLKPVIPDSVKVDIQWPAE
jgi:hypothetical protein